MASGAAFLYGIVRRHAKQRRRRLLPLDICQRIGCVAKPRVAVLAHHHQLQIWGVPPLGYDADGFVVTDLPCRNGPRVTRSFGVHAIDFLRSERLLLHVFLGVFLPATITERTLFEGFACILSCAWETRYFARDLLVRLKEVFNARHRVADDYEGMWLS